MSIIHISEEEALADFGAVLSRYDAGDEIFIDRGEGQIRLVASDSTRLLTLKEAIARLPKDSIGVVDEDFAGDVRSFRKHHSESLTSGPMPEELPKGRTVAEMIAILKQLPGERGVMDADFAHDVANFRKRHPESLDGSKWD